MTFADLQVKWREREPRERFLLTFAAFFVLAVLIYSLAVDPLLSAGRRAERALPQLRRQAADMNRMAERAELLKKRASRAVPSASASDLERSAAGYGLAPRVTAAGEGRFEVVLGQSAMTGLIRWLAGLQDERHLFVREARLTAAGGGLVEGSLVLAP